MTKVFLKNDYEKRKFVKKIKAEGFVRSGVYGERGQSWVDYDKGNIRWQIEAVESYLVKDYLKKGFEANLITLHN